jgi:polysaccharide export outer membrane protein
MCILINSMRGLPKLFSSKLGRYLALIALLGAQSSTGWAQALPDYHLQPGDQVELSVWGEEDLQRTVLVRPDGRISFPLAGEIPVEGRTTVEIEQEITERLAAYIPEAVVTISVTGIEGNRIYVIGQVENPGSFVMNPQLRVMQALSLAGGTTAFAALDDIIIIRSNGPEQEIYEFAYGDVSRGRNLGQNILLQSGDVVVVP